MFFLRIMPEWQALPGAAGRCVCRHILYMCPCVYSSVCGFFAKKPYISGKFKPERHEKFIYTDIYDCYRCCTDSCCGASKSEAPWIVDRFDDIKVIRYEVPGFEQLPLAEKELVYYLAEAAKCGRDILFDQNFKYNLPVRRTLEVIYENYDGDRTTPEWKALEKYLKKVWFANGIHHHYSNDKFVPEFPKEYFLAVAESIPVEKFGDELNALRAVVCEAIFNPELYKTQLNQPKVRIW